MEQYQSYPPKLKLKLVRLMQSGDMPVAQISREYQVTRSLLYYWWQQYRERGEAAFAPTKEGLASPSVSRPQTPDEQVARLERLCGQQALEIDRLQSEVDLLKKAWHLLPFPSDTL
jgi:transposase-like protein